MGAIKQVAGCNADAALVILDHGLTLDHVVEVDVDHILYVNALMKARTLWLHVPEHGKMRIEMEEGFVAWPPDGWHDLRPGDKPPPRNYGLAGSSA